MLIPAILLLVGLALAGNYAYVLLARRSRARLALRDLLPVLRRRQQQVLRHGEELCRIAPELNEHLRLVLELGRAMREEAQGLPDPSLVTCENDLALAMDSLLRSEPPELRAQPLWTELREAWMAGGSDLSSPSELYNKQVRRYNDSLGVFPGNWAARLLRLQPMPLIRR
jgi:hypothetical protein